MHIHYKVIFSLAHIGKVQVYLYLTIDRGDVFFLIEDLDPLQVLYTDTNRKAAFLFFIPIEIRNSQGKIPFIKFESMYLRRIALTLLLRYIFAHEAGAKVGTIH